MPIDTTKVYVTDRYVGDDASGYLTIADLREEIHQAIEAGVGAREPVLILTYEDDTLIGHCAATALVLIDSTGGQYRTADYPDGMTVADVTYELARRRTASPWTRVYRVGSGGPIAQLGFGTP